MDSKWGKKVKSEVMSDGDGAATGGWMDDHISEIQEAAVKAKR